MSEVAFSLDAEFLNRVANHPEVRPWLGAGDAIDFCKLFEADSEAFALVNEHGGVILIHKGDGEYEFHTMFLPSGRGRAAVRAGAEILSLMFGRYSAMAMKTYVPHDNRAALGLVRLCGFRQTHADAENSYWVMSREQWQTRQSGGEVTMGG